MKLSKISTDILWSIFKIQWRIIKRLEPTPQAPNDDDIERIKSGYPLGGGVIRKAAIIGIRDNDINFRDTPCFSSEVCQAVYSEFGVDYRDIVTNPASNIKKILKRSKILNDNEYYLVKDFLLDTEYNSNRDDLSLILRKYEKDQ